MRRRFKSLLWLLCKPNSIIYKRVEAIQVYIETEGRISNLSMLPVTDTIFEKEPMLDFEANFLVGNVASITTATFFRSDDVGRAVLQLRERFTAVLVANPWLAGRLVTHGEKTLTLSYPKADAITEAHVTELFDDARDLQSVDVAMTYEEICAQVQMAGAWVVNGNALKDKDLPICKVTILAAGKNTFAFVFSITHCAADGKTSYDLLNAMLSSTPAVSVTNAKRKLLDYNTEDAVGASTSEYMTSFSCMLSRAYDFVKGKLGLRRFKVFSFYVNQDEVARIKALAKAADEVDFLSTNDIVVSAIMNKLNVELCLMAVNLRGRNPKVAPMDAGNYAGFSIYRKSVFSTPEGIRKSIDGSKGLPFPEPELCGHPLPGHFQRLTLNSGIVTNWASFAEEFDVCGCDELLHLPLVYNQGLLFIDLVIYETNSRPAVMIFSRHFERAHWESIAVLGDPVSESIFC